MALSRYAEQFGWRLRVGGVCRQAARQFLKQNPELARIRYIRLVTPQITKQGDTFAQYIRTRFTTDPARVEMARLWFVTRVWNELQVQRLNHTKRVDR